MLKQNGEGEWKSFLRFALPCDPAAFEFSNVASANVVFHLMLKILGELAWDLLD